MTNKEYGSDFHYLDNSDFKVNKKSTKLFNGTEQLYFSGRVALRAIISNGIERHSWKKIYIPTYYCHEVYVFVRDLNIEFEWYECNPLQNILPTYIKDIDKCAVLVVNYFGISIPDFSHLKNCAVIEDVTHDLSLITQSKADNVFGSLRKILPVPVGGFVKSKEKLRAIDASLMAEEVALEKLTGMFLKKKYLSGSFKDKETFRQLLITAENSFENCKTFGRLPLMIESYFSDLDIDKIIKAKQSNSILAKQNLKSNSKFKLLSNNENTEFALILWFESPQCRDELRSYLITKQIYPMILWPNQFKYDDIVLEKSLLFIHIDFRYTTKDIIFITDTINNFYNNA